MRLGILLVVGMMVLPLANAKDARLSNVPYPFPVQTFRFSSQQQELEMTYMEVPPMGTSRGDVLLLHGKNFIGAYWEETARALAGEGYRIIIPDQIGFGKSSKPGHYQFTFHQLAHNTKALLGKIAVTNVHVVGHSMGGMLATRFALLYPETTQSLILVNPIGLEDWQAEGVPYQTLDQQYQQELGQTREKIRQYQLENYYHGEWKPGYDRWLDMAAAMIEDPDYPKAAWNQALTYEMIFTQPVCHKFNRLSPPVLLVIGQKDRTAIGAALVSPDIRKQLGNYPQLGKATAAAIPRAKLVELPDLGHAPQLENFPGFIEPVKQFLKNQP